MYLIIFPPPLHNQYPPSFDVGSDVDVSLQLAITDYINRSFGGQGTVTNKIGRDETTLRTRVYETAASVLLKK